MIVVYKQCKTINFDGTNDLLVNKCCICFISVRWVLGVLWNENIFFVIVSSCRSCYSVNICFFLAISLEQSPIAACKFCATFNVKGSALKAGSVVENIKQWIVFRLHITLQSHLWRYCTTTCDSVSNFFIQWRETMKL